MVEPGILVDVDTTPTAVVIFINRNDADGHALAGKVAFPQRRGPRFFNDAGLPGLLAVVLLTLDFIRSIRRFKTRKYQKILLLT